MKKKFLKELNRGLVPLNKKERNRYLSNYKEIILDKMESGFTEEDAVYDLGEVKPITNDILNSYTNTDKTALTDNIKYINKNIIVFDIIVLLLSYLLAYFLCFKGGLFILITKFPANLVLYHASFSNYMRVMLLAIPIYLILYYLFKLYTIKYVRHLSLEIRNIIFANIVGLMVVFLALYLFREMHISRLFLITFTIINIIFQIIIRTLYYRFFKN